MCYMVGAIALYKWTLTLSVPSTCPPLMHFRKTGVLQLPFPADCYQVLMCDTKMTSQHNDTFSVKVHGFMCDLAEQSWAFEGRVMSAGLALCVTWLNRAALLKAETESYECSAGFVCDLAEWSWAFEGRVMSAVLALCVS